MEEILYQNIVSHIAEKGFDINQLKKTVQAISNPAL